MAKSISRIKKSLRRIGNIQVNDWDFVALLNKDIKDVEIAKSLRKLGNTEVIKWDFRTVMPAVGRIANREVNLVGIIKRTANYKVIEWDFRKPYLPDPTEAPVVAASPKLLDLSDKHALTECLENFLRFVAINLVTEPNHLNIATREISPNVLRVKIVLIKRDAAILIGTQGHTAAAIRHILKARAQTYGVHVLLQIISHEAEMASAR